MGIFFKLPRIVILRRRRVVAALCILGAAAIFAAVNLPYAAVSAYATDRQLPIYSVDCQEKRCAISFDAAWGNEDTELLIKILDQYNVKTTFFVVGDWVDKYPESVKALSDAGHEVMSHSSHHDHYNSLTTDEIVADCKAANEKIEAVTGRCPTLIRCPYGEYDDHVITAIRSIGMEPIQWDVDSLDWKDYDAATIFERVTEKVAPGSIVLFHNAALHTPAALPSILENLQSQGYEIVPISELIYPGQKDVDYTIDHTGKQFPANPT